ncbi:MAG: hypothetical protein OIF40_00875 [Mangrovicoccus sp.]|nr:hypothetical protein [Mangrovicoccus sp.]
MSASKSAARSWLRRGAVLSISAIAGLGALVITPNGPSAPSAAPHDPEALQKAMKDPVEARDFCELGREMLFPITDPGNQVAAQDLFYEAIERDPLEACGYAGLAHSLATISLLVPDGLAQNAVISDAQLAAEEAVRLNPISGWSHSAAAWTSFAAGDTVGAITQSGMAERLSPSDGNVLDFHALTLVLAGKYVSAFEVSNPERMTQKQGDRRADQNLHGAASFHLGLYSEAIATLEHKVTIDQHASDMALVYLSASYAALERLDRAEDYAEQLMEAAPDYPVDDALTRLYRRPGAAEEVLSQLQRAGWQAPAS